MKNINGLPLYLLLLPINLIVAFIALILAPILPLFASEDGWNIHTLCKNGKQEGVKAKYRFTPKLGKIN